MSLLSNRDTFGNVLMVAVSLCLVCSVIVSGAAIALKPAQLANKELDRRANILIAAGLLEEGQTADAAGNDINTLFESFEVRAIDFSTDGYTDAVDTATYDQLRAARDPQLSRELSEDEDKATIGRLENIGLVYIQRDGEAIRTIVVPIRGYGLWGTLYGYLALDGDLDTVAGLGFYQHQETPGLGGEVDNSKWKAKWDGVDAFNDETPAVRLVKGRSPQGSETARHEIDALAGATMTTRGVENLVNFWLGDMAYGPYLSSLRRGEG